MNLRQSVKNHYIIHCKQLAVVSDQERPLLSNMSRLHPLQPVAASCPVVGTALRGPTLKGPWSAPQPPPWWGVGAANGQVDSRQTRVLVQIEPS
ncbi:hypothetical protein HUJ05_010859 [Dendroctonus ponderosae]|nr:hypothetical protein HUJ05_010859 [Dendroctonus ponderosae]